MSLKVFAKDFDLEYFGTRFHLEHFHILTTQEIGLPSLQTIYMCSQRIRASMSLIDSCLCVLLSACQCVCLCNCFAKVRKEHIGLKEQDQGCRRQ